MTEWLIGAGVALVAVIAAWITGRRSGAKDEATANQAQKADAYEKHLNEIADATAARNAVDPDGLPDNDKYRRD